MKIEIEETTVTRTTARAVITGAMIRKAFKLPPTARIVFAVPGGGDWSNSEIEIDATNHVEAVWTTEVEKNITDTIYGQNLEEGV